MNHLLRLAVCASLLGLFALGAAALHPAVLAELGLDFWEWPGLQQALDGELQRGEELSQRVRVAEARNLAKDRIARELIAGRIGLAAAVARFGELPDPPEGMWQRLQSEFAAGKVESLSRHVISWSCELLASQPVRAGALRRRLDGELQEYLHGP